MQNSPIINTPSKSPYIGLVKRLVASGVLDQKKAVEAYHHANHQKINLITYLAQAKIVSNRDLATAASAELGIPLIDIDAIEIDPEIIKLVAENLIRKYRCLPLFKRGNRLFIAIADPSNMEGLEEIRFHVRLSTEPILVEEDKLIRMIDKAVEAADTTLTNIIGGDLTGLEDLDINSDPESKQEDSSEVDDAPVVRFVNKMLLDAIKRQASDLHFEPYEKFFRLRFRIDGILTEVTQPPLVLANKITSRIKVMARLNVAERRVPQDGRIKLRLSKNKSIDFRVSTCPTIYGEKTVMRILDSDPGKLDIDMLGLGEDQKALVLHNLKKPHGMFLVTGPTGSGKTVTLYTGINILNQEDVNISTAEDPVEINLPGVNQVQMDERSGMTFAKALKAFLRQDPDIILVGEIRDTETASIAVKAAQTGHMVMSTLHTNDAPQTLTRLQDMGIEPYAVATTINVIIAQRLARRLCNVCKQPLTLPDDLLIKEGFSPTEIATGMQLFQAVGCDQCNQGYRGRVGLYQVMPITDAMKRLIMQGANAIELQDLARSEGVNDIRQAGLAKVKSGITTLEEINSVTME